MYWKTGFYHIARGANVPIVLGYLDYRRKVGGIGPVVHPTGNMEGDMKIIRDFYAHSLEDFRLGKNLRWRSGKNDPAFT